MLQGGIANAGAVLRDGDHVLRPSNPHTATIHDFLRFLRSAGFEAASLPLGVEADGRERLEFIAGDVAFPPYPAWAETDMALATAAAVLRRLHDAGAGYVAPAGATWSTEMADPQADSVATTQLVICHNDVCLENVVYRDRVAVGLLDFDFAAPGRRVLGPGVLRPHERSDRHRRGRQAARADRAVRRGASAAHRRRRVRPPTAAGAFLAALAEGVQRGGEFLQRRLDEGNEAFRQMVASTGGMAKFERRRAWFAAHRDELAAALG